MNKKSYLMGVGSYLPSKVLTNQDLEHIVDTSDAWITTRTGISERRIASEEETTSYMGEQAARKLFAQYQIDPQTVDLILVATVTPDYLVSPTAGIIQHRLNLHGIPAFDVQAACSGFLYGLSIAQSFVASGTYQNILLIASEKMSGYTDYTDRSTCILFGDGASAALVTSKPQGFLINHVLLGADGEGTELIYIPSGGTKNPVTIASVENKECTFKMQGREVFRHAVRRMNAAAVASLEKEGLGVEDVAYFIPHQANSRIIDSMIERLRLPKDRVLKTVHKYGNTSASSVSIALDELCQANVLTHGDRLLLVTFGAGLTWGSSIVTYQSHEALS